MWAYQLTSPGTFERTDVPEPSDDLPTGQVLLRTLAGGICGSDLPKFRSSTAVRPTTFPALPGFPMHEVVGSVIASGHHDVPVGSMVVGWSVDSTALAQYVVTDGDQVLQVSATADPVAAVLVQSLACVLFALRRTPVVGRHVAVIGLGPIGLLFAHELARLGARRVTGVDKVDRRDLADRFGIDDLIVADASAWVSTLHPADQPDLVVEAVGHQTSTLQNAVDACASGGEILYFGIPDQEIYPINMESLVRKNLSLRAGVTRDRRAMLAIADERLGGQVEAYRSLITTVLPFDRVQEAFDLACRPRPGQAKIALTACETPAR